MNHTYISAIITAAGLSERMNASVNKNLIELDGVPILSMTIRAFTQNPYVDEIIVVHHKNELQQVASILEKIVSAKPIKLIPGGTSRQESAYLGLSAVDKKCEIVAIHDAARPFVSQTIITETIRAAIEHGASCAAVKTKDTSVLAKDGIISELIDRSNLYALQTPQTFRYDWIKRAHELANDSNITATDDTALIKHLGYDVTLTEGSYDNIKITTKEDLLFAQVIINRNNGGGTHVH